MSVLVGAAARRLMWTPYEGVRGRGDGLREMDSEARIREIVREELAHEARNREQYATDRRSPWLDLADKLATDGDIKNANKLRVVYGLPPIPTHQGREHLFCLHDVEFDPAHGVDDACEHGTDVVGVGIGFAGGEDVGDVVDEFGGDRGAVIAPIIAEAEGVSQWHDASPSLGADTRSVGDGPGRVGNTGPGHT